ncbi:MAG: homoserine O-succinyltransferase, partial [Clostridia bacterium]|nr:homoserine O-succinyltransferase [Clostridia bacterium]
MPIIIPKALPAFSILNDENVFVMPKVRAETQDIRPIEIAIVNLMPTKIETETQLMRLLGNSSLQVNVTLIKMGSYESKNTSAEHLDKFYQTFDEIKDKKFDGMIVTGAPVETLPFEQVMYWEELTQIMDYADKNVTSTIFICWGAQAGLNYYYGIQKPLLPKKMFGIYPNKATMKFDKLLKGMDDVFYIPFSRHSTVDENAIRANEHLEVLAECIDGGISIVKSVDNRKFFFMGHSEYDRDTLKNEYLRDLAKGEKIDPPINY